MSDVQPISLRCSQLPAAFLCPGSARAPDVRINIGSDAATMGTACHAIMERIVSDQPYDVAEVAERFRVDPKELGILAWYGAKAWGELAALRPSSIVPLTEFEMTTILPGGVQLSGHTDMLTQSESDKVFRVYVDDWKSGRKDHDYYHQLAGYARLVFDDDDSVEEVIGSAIWLRDQEVEGYTFTRAKIKDWESSLVSEVVNWDGVYHPGEACEHCSRSHECPAVTAMVRRDVEMFAATADQVLDLASMSGPQLVQMRRRAKVVAKFCESFDHAFREEVKIRRTVDSGDGTVIGFVEENGKRQIDVLKAWPWLAEQFTAEEMAEFVDVSASGLDELVKKKAPKGKGAGAIRELKTKLEALGALHQPKVYKLRERRRDQ